ncbi:MAG: divalent cation tolerance protein CutA [Candidatus Norongarragalinales archaeon]
MNKKRKIVLLFCACANEREAKIIARALVRERLAACVNLLPRVSSVYWWRGKIAEGMEALLVAKTTRAKARAAARRITALHSYELPCIELVETSVENKVASWIKESVNS